MQTYVVMRRSGWKDSSDVEDALAHARQVADEELADQVKWIRSYVLEEEDGTFGTVCVYQADDEDILMEHAQRADLPADEVITVDDTVIFRDDP